MALDCSFFADTVARQKVLSQLTAVAILALTIFFAGNLFTWVTGRASRDVIDWNGCGRECANRAFLPQLSRGSVLSERGVRLADAVSDFDTHKFSE